MFQVDKNWEIAEMGNMLSAGYRVYPIIEVSMPGMPIYNLVIKITEKLDNNEIIGGDLHFLCGSVMHTMAIIDNHKKAVKKYQISAQISEGNGFKNLTIKKILRGIYCGQEVYIFIDENEEHFTDFGVDESEIKNLKTVHLQGISLVPKKPVKKG